ncbi:N-acetylmuramoyl-L-alanine amidase [Desulfovibrio mangrovi]|uniref:N-acetylmuramoyl-L-alanine amidase n=1 Tax=Desulfovibrio mangrovi TaxID=2976983 RepID=UPI002246FAEF|nr:N-acetylmuramoyl-L-alanine amidase [Desulfovibrio mangrovi]UZP68575.1 N-acetylmuramoyl-L-alanine amidase [Desulfovibrio mangrovi]
MADVLTRRVFLRRMATGLAAQGLLGVLSPMLPAQTLAGLPPPDTFVPDSGTNATLTPETASRVFDLAMQGQNLLAEGRYEDALRVLRQAAGLSSEDDFVQGLLGRALLATGEQKAAIVHFRTAASLNPEDTYSRMMADMLSQRPAAGGAVANAPAKPLTPLEAAARQEEERMARWLAEQQGAGTGTGYRIRRVVLDPGHGGFDSGAVGSYGLKEKDVNLALALGCAAMLERQAPDLRVFLTRTEDYYVPLSARTAVANQYSADIFISFHCNASENRDARGVETYFCSERASSNEAQRVARFENAVLRYEDTAASAEVTGIEELLFRYERRRYWQAADAAAGFMQQVLAARLQLPDRGVHSADFYVLRKARMPSVLLETGFVSNMQEERLLADSGYRQRIAASVAAGIIRLAGAGRS